MSIWIFLKVKKKKKKAEVFKNSSAHNDIMIKIQKKSESDSFAESVDWSLKLRIINFLRYLDSN